MTQFDQITKANKELMDGSLAAVATMTKASQAVATEMTEYAKSAAEAGQKSFEKISATKTLDKAFEVQADYAKSSYETFVAQSQKIGELYMNAMKEAYKPFEAMAPKAAK